MENGAIADGQITASTIWDSYFVAHAARLRLKPFLSSSRIGAWVAGTNYGDLSPWLQVDLGLQFNITRVATQGRQEYPQWVTSYNLQKSDDGVMFDYYMDQEGQRKVRFLNKFLLLFVEITERFRMTFTASESQIQVVNFSNLAMRR